MRKNARYENMGRNDTKADSVSLFVPVQRYVCARAYTTIVVYKTSDIDRLCVCFGLSDFVFD